MADRAFVPADFSIPGELVAPPFRLEPLGPQHNGADYAAWTSSIEHISATPGFIGRDWPDPAMSPDDNLADLQRHADDFASRTGFTYTVIEIASGETIGCVYIYPARGEGFDVAECLEFTENSPVQQAFRTLLFSRIVPCVKDIGLWGPKVRHAYTDLGVIDAAKTDLEALMRDDEEIAERVDAEKYAAELAARQAEVDEAVAEGAGAG